MSGKQDLLAAFKEAASAVEKKKFDHITRESVVTELGVDSLALMQIVSELETKLGVMIPDEDLVEIVTVGDLCKKVEQRL